MMKNILKMILKYILAAIIVGLFISFYQFLGHIIINGSNYLLNNSILIFVLTIIISLIGIISLMYINKRIPGYYGSGIPQIEGYYRGWCNFNPFKMLPLLFVNSLYAFFTGFLLGSEGPSISMSTCIGMISNDIDKKDDKDLEACCGSAGFACAFASPLAGLFHLLEENKNRISFKFIFKGIFIISIAFFISYFVYPHDLLPKFDVDYLPLKYYWLLIIMIILCFLISHLYMYIMIKIKTYSKKRKIMIYLTPILMVGFMVLRRFIPILVGNGGESLKLNIIDYSLIILFLILLFRIIFTGFSVCSNISGGLVLPTLAIGALSGFVLVKIISLFDVNILQYTAIFVICGMFGVFGVVTKSPLTGLVLCLKCAPVDVIILPGIIVILISYIITHLLKCDNVYHKLEKLIDGYPYIEIKTGE